jgi:hypothetical protein
MQKHHGASSTFVAMGIFCAVSALLWKTAFLEDKKLKTPAPF